MLRTHVGLNVTNLASSIDFYSKVFNEAPVKVKDDYAKFLPEQLALNFTLNSKEVVTGNQVGHFGIQVASLEEVLNQKDRLQELGFFAREEMNTNCCYALQDKFWVTDPDGNEWEFFFTKQDNEGKEGALKNESNTI
ncbi:ArsI/CadI family heavy metal resistance metalloenzyme [Bacillus sp. N1-1]|uniref:ArsI/CadI family heavy metal resistance metalloenzyme n=1 Tax=Bacillus sp. N1-1 TaxID=2682541 RepID=UPI001315B34D|nr:ArsI/CadI family heavy metal resistance metalloenzyme [Bacillus sp. N1-1]QHA90926.1 glyoxalase/bleomycin resistance/dioxygenase family protein [Bacillus sp. N1-1]